LYLLSDDNNDNPIIIGCRCCRVSKHTMWSYYDWVYCCCCPSVNTICGRVMIGLSFLSSSVNTICGRVMIGLSLSSVSEHNMCYCYDWVVVVVFRLLTQYLVRPHIAFTDEDNDNPIIIRPHIVFTDGRQQRQPNYNMTTYYVY
jgi:hypothetical protein